MNWTPRPDKKDSLTQELHSWRASGNARSRRLLRRGRRGRRGWRQLRRCMAQTAQTQRRGGSGRGGGCGGRREDSWVREVAGGGGRLEDVGGEDGVAARPRQSHLLPLVLHPPVLEPHLQTNQQCVVTVLSGYSDTLWNLNFSRTVAGITKWFWVTRDILATSCQNLRT